MTEFSPSYHDYTKNKIQIYLLFTSLLLFTPLLYFQDRANIMKDLVKQTQKEGQIRSKSTDIGSKTSRKKRVLNKKQDRDKIQLFVLSDSSISHRLYHKFLRYCFDRQISLKYCNLEIKNQYLKDFMNMFIKMSLQASLSKGGFSRTLSCQRASFFSKMYSKNHEWIEYMNEPNKYRIGLTHHAQEQLGQIVYVEISGLNKFYKTCSSVAVIQSVKTTAQIYAPADGKIVGSNSELVDSPTLLNQKAEETWILEMQCEIPPSNLLSKREYDELVENENK